MSRARFVPLGEVRALIGGLTIVVRASFAGSCRSLRSHLKVVGRRPLLLIAARVAALVMCLTFALCLACVTGAKLVARFTSRLPLQGKI